MISDPESALVTPAWEHGEQIETSREAELDDGVEQLRHKVEKAGSYLPLVYQYAFVAPLLKNMPSAIRQNNTTLESWGVAEALAGAVIQHARAEPTLHNAHRSKQDRIRRAAQQFLAVVSNLYRTFLAPEKRMDAQVPLAAAVLPPLVVFHHFKHVVGQNRIIGPGILTSEKMRLICDSKVAVVVMPAAFYCKPLAWVAAAHEASGHEMLQADRDLLPDLIDGIRSLFGGGVLAPGENPDLSQALGLLWSHWAEEAASDVYGILNIGPTFAFNLAAFLVGYRAGRHQQIPYLNAASQAQPSGVDSVGKLGPHPVDLLRLHIAIGVLQNLIDLPSVYIRGYTQALDKLSKRYRPKGQNKIVIDGSVQIRRDRWIRLQVEIPLNVAFESARRVGAFIASTRLGALGNHTIQDVETWDLSDELNALNIRDKLQRNGTISRAGDDGHLLAGAMLAALEQPNKQHASASKWFDSINERLGDALDASFQDDALVGVAELHSMFGDAEH